LDRLTTEEFNGFDAQGSLTGALTSGAGSVAAGWGRTLWGGAPGGLAAGVAAKALREEHAGVSARGFAVDLGFQARPWGEPARRHPWLRRTSAGLSLKNMGTGPRFDRESAPLPLEAVFGLGYAHFISGDSASFAADLRRVEGEGMSVSLGAEYWHDEFVALRAGWRSGAEDGPGLSAGAGFRLSWTQIDYAWTGFGEDLGAAHRFSFSVRFGRPAPDLSEELFRFHAEEGRRQMEAGNCARATLSFDRALKIRPGDAETLKRLLECGERLEAGP
jgi:hypothetical protein